ncbi:hypothetical protein K431DRAFT_282244 [Polychaeton citri CBS 116435]|uniref:Uncharacterized protein n=1 Tax=Polychaeton citri CBS 116435 TaxID=1314669 RepID=A0A9P4QFN8_9PEZI|nr:hypothetical protein K431DRAFT_282244 [Polychaeton citri CBS 116435]
MLPPVTPAVLKANPRFEALYRDLCNNKLNKDGTTKLNEKAQKDCDITTHDLRKLRIQAARADIIKHGLNGLAISADALPDELQENVEVLSAFLNGEVSKEDIETVEMQVEVLRGNAHRIAKALSTQLQRDSDTLARIVDPSNPPQVTQLAPAARSIKASTHDLSEELASYRLSLTHDAVAVHAVQREIMETSIRLLEQSICGLVARSSKAKAEYLALMAEGMAKKLTLKQGELLSQVYSSAFRETLSNKYEELELEVRAIKRKIEKAVRAVEAYGKEGTMRDMAKEYAELKAETDRVKEEIARLEDGR